MNVVKFEMVAPPALHDAFTKYTPAHDGRGVPTVKFREYVPDAPMAKTSELVEKYRRYGCEYLVVFFFPLKNYVLMMRDFGRHFVPSF